jgi:hypothetical protein
MIQATNDAHRAYNDMLFLCEKYAPSEGLERYNSVKDISVTGAYLQHSTQIMAMNE